MKTNKGMLGLALAVICIAGASIASSLMAQTGQQSPPRSEYQYFVTGEGDEAHLWVREGTKLKCIGHGECKAHADHKPGDGHAHDKP